MVSEYKLLEICDKIQANKINERLGGLNELKQLFSREQTPKNLNDKAFHRLLEAIFRATIIERTLYIKQSKTARGASGTRLTLCGSVLRSTVELGREQFKVKTVRAVYRHIMDTLPANEELCEPISIDYTKSLRMILQYAPHTEHLMAEAWEALAKYCCDHVNKQLGIVEEADGEEEEEEDEARELEVRSSRRGSRASVPRDSLTSSSGRRNPAAQAFESTGRLPMAFTARLTHVSEELLMCLQYLLSAPNAPILPNVQMLSTTLLGFLKSQQTSTRAHQHVFSSINHVLNVVTANDLGITTKICNDIVPIISRLWDTKSPGLRDEMIVTFMHCQPHIRVEIRVTPKENPLRVAVENLFESLCSEYIARSDREILQLDYVVFPSPASASHSTSPLRLRAVALTNIDHDPRLEQTWMVPSLIATMVEMLDISGSTSKKTADGAPKRQRIYDRSAEMMRYVRSMNAPRKFLALQVMSFLADINGIDEEEFPSIIQDLNGACSDDNPLIIAWALIAIGSCAFLRCAPEEVYAPTWLQVWRLCARHATNQSTCRVACHIMRILISRELIAYPSILKDVDNTLQAIDISGPAILCDSALALWSLILEKRNSTVHTAQYHAGERLFQWFCSKWRPAQEGLDKSGAIVYSQNTAAVNVINFLLVCCGLDPLKIDPYPIQICGPIGQACIRIARYRGLHNMLLHVEESTDDAQLEGSSFGPGSAGKPHTDLQKQMIAFLLRQMETVGDKWAEICSQKQGVNSVVMQNFVGTILTASILCAKLSYSSSVLEEKLRESVYVSLGDYLVSDECSLKQIDGLLFEIQALLPKASRMVGSPGRFEHNLEGVTASLIVQISDVLEGKEKAAISFRDSGEKDAMDIDHDDFGFPSGRMEEEKKIGLLREDVEAACSEESFRSTTSAQLALCSMLLKNPEQPEEVCGQFASYLKEIPTHKLVMIRSFVRDFVFAASDVLRDNDAANICEHIAHELLAPYLLERCEISSLLTMDIITALANKWSVGSGPADITETCEQVYDHVIKTGLDKKVTSHAIRIGIADLLERILHVNPNFGKDDPQPPLELFIGLLKDSDSRVIYFVSQKLHTLFKIFGESAHLKLTEDIEAALPSAKDWVEGLAIRVYALGLVGLVSLSNISRIVYRIFETGQLPQASLYAANSLLTIAKAFGFESQRQLFKLFSVQLLYTWTEHYELDNFPSEVFGYGSLTEMCEDVPDELIAQLLVRDRDEQAEAVAQRNGKSLSELLVPSFAKVVAYCMAWAVRYPPQAPAEGEAPRPPLIARIRAILGDGQYRTLFITQFPLIISNLYELMQEDGTSEKLLSRDVKLANVAAAMKDLIAEGYSERKLAHQLPPRFSTRVILNTIPHACDICGINDSNELWHASMVTYIARRLFDTLHPARGPVHACGVLRNIRLLVCLAGNTAHEGYQLQMLIHGLKTYIVDIACAEDVVGIIRYLLIKGNGYLSKKPSFVIATFLSIMADIKEFMQKNFDTLEEQTRTTLSVVRKFRTWFADHLSTLVFTNLDMEQNRAFQAMVHSAVQFRRIGNAEKDTKESELIRLLLDDDMAGDAKLMDDASRELAFSLFCGNFQRPGDFRDDIFGSDQVSFDRSKSMLEICRHSSVGDGFLLWSARVLGRAYAATGQLHNEWTHEMTFEDPNKNVLPRANAVIKDYDLTARIGILRRLRDLLFSNDKVVAGVAERALSQIVREESHRGESDTYLHVLENHEYKALQIYVPVSENLTPQSLAPFRKIETPVPVWLKDLTVAMCTNMRESPVINGLIRVLREVKGVAAELFPCITQVLLARDHLAKKGLREDLSSVFRECFKNHTEKTVAHNTVLIKTILYLRSRPRDGETTASDRDFWLEVDFLEAAKAACACKMFKTALLFTEIHNFHTKMDIPPELLLEIFQNVDDPDSFYGVNQEYNLRTVLHNFEYEGNGWKSLSLRAANLESGIRQGQIAEPETLGVVDAFNTLGMNGLSHSFLQEGARATTSARAVDNIYRSAWKLEQWDLPCPTGCNTRSTPIFRALQSLNNTVDARPTAEHTDPHFLGVMKQMISATQTNHTLGENMRTLAMLTEMEEVLASADRKQLTEAWDRQQGRSAWMDTGRYAEVEEMMAMRQATFGSLAKRMHLRMRSGTDVIGEKNARKMEAKTLISCCKMARKHEILQHAISAATQLENLVQPCKDAGLDISGVAALQAANVLWLDGHAVASIHMLSALEQDTNATSQSIEVGRAKLLAILGSRISEARLEKPDKIMSRYLENAIIELNHKETGSEAGRVFHLFATFCDQQLQNPNNIEDYERALKLKRDKEGEVNQLAQMMHSSANKNAVIRENVKAKSWLALDEEEYSHLRNNRDAFLEKSVANYLKCLIACDDFDHDAVRFSALWLAHWDEDRVNRVATDVENVPTRKLVPLINQLSSRLQSEKGAHSIHPFQSLLLRLIIRMCQQHPYHGIYQILAISKTRTKDEASISRQRAALQVTKYLKSGNTKNAMYALETTTKVYDKLAHATGPQKLAKGRSITLKDLIPDCRKVFERDIGTYNIPPPTMHIAIRADCDYSSLPIITRFNPLVVLASGVSMPKIIKCEASDGNVFKQLVKGGQDDLRQDAIMEQVFEQVSILLRKWRMTRQRDLKIRSYMVIPLTATSGIIEFVANTIPLLEYLFPAHTKYFPNAWAPSKARKVISDAQNRSRTERVRAYRLAAENFPPVLHFFFMHEFEGPDLWFASRLAYTRSTAAISILGHILGLGDRHGHNILLDRKTGEVIHIDLGVAFEQGRVLPVPEVVPFRLTRDIVSGFGITGTEGVFRRCCEYTLEVLRNESYSITTVLDVLKYDPLYSWSLSPLRMKRIQDHSLEQKEQERLEEEEHAAKEKARVRRQDSDGKEADEKKKKLQAEAEAERALTVVSKKLSKTLSVSATVNELIQQAADAKNLAVLYSGWGAYA